MKKIILCLLFMSSAYTLFAQPEIVVDPNATARALPGNFKAIKISGGIDLYLSQSDQAAIAVSASEERFKEGIKTTVENNMLHIYYEGDKKWNSQKKKLKVYVSFNNLEKLHASGACDVVVSGSITVPSLVLQLSGACDFKGKLAVDQLSLNLSGASDVIVSGTANSVKIESSGASDVKGYELVTDYCTARASGASDINITVNKELNATASGASNIHFKGNGLIKGIQNSGSSKVEKKGR